MSDRLEEIRARCEAATKGPWAWVIDLASINPWVLHMAQKPSAITMNLHPYPISRPDPDADFIVHSRDDIEWLIAEVERLRRLKEFKIIEHPVCSDLLEENEVLKRSRQRLMSEVAGYQTDVENLRAKLAVAESEIARLKSENTRAAFADASEVEANFNIAVEALEKIADDYAIDCATNTARAALAKIRGEK